jgi:hypothetical protein
VPIVLSQDANPDRFTARHWMFIPNERVTQPPNPPAVPYRGLIILTGIAIIDLQGASPASWRRERVILRLDRDFARAAALAPWAPNTPGNFLVFQSEQWAPFVTVNARYNRGPADNDGTAVDSFWLDLSAGKAVINIDVAVRDVDAFIYRLGYSLHLYGRLEEFAPVP